MLAGCGGPSSCASDPTSSSFSVSISPFPDYFDPNMMIRRPSDLNVVMTVIILIITIVNENWDRFAPFLFFSAKSAVSY